MIELLPPFPMLITFISASFILAIIPGPVVLYVVTRTLTQGRASGLASVAGVTLGNFGNALGACFGLAALFAISSMAFMVVKFLGALYLIYLGVKTIYSARAKSADTHIPQIQKSSHCRIFIDGFIVALLNPKTALFFAAFLPQFLSPGAESHLMQSIALSMIFVLIASLTDVLYALIAGCIMPFLKRNRSTGTIGKYISGSIFIGLGVFTAFAPQKTQ